MKSKLIAGIVCAAILAALAAPSAAYTRPGVTRMVSLAPGGAPKRSLPDPYGAPDGFANPVISANARYVAFASMAYDLVTPDLNNPGYDVFERNLGTGETGLVDVSSSGQQGIVSSMYMGGDRRYSVAISANGRFVAF